MSEASDKVLKGYFNVKFDFGRSLLAGQVANLILIGFTSANLSDFAQKWLENAVTSAASTTVVYAICLAIGVPATGGLAVAIGYAPAALEFLASLVSAIQTDIFKNDLGRSIADDWATERLWDGSQYHLYLLNLGNPVSKVRLGTADKIPFGTADKIPFSQRPPAKPEA